MIWGYGTIGYGSWRVRKMLESINAKNFDFSQISGDDIELLLFLENQA